MLFLIGLTAPPCTALESGVVLRRGFIREITNSSASNYNIQRFRMNRDATHAVFLVTQTTLDGRGCNAQQLRLINIDGTGERIIEQGFTFDTGVGNFCASSLTPLFDISDDGTRVVYVRRVSPSNLNFEIVNYTVSSSAKTSILQTVPYRSLTVDGTRPIDPQMDFGLFRIAGNGANLFFVNRFGPLGSPGISGEPGPSGFTLYRVAVPSGTPTPLFSQLNLAAMGGLVAGTEGLVVFGGKLATNAAGTLVLLPVGTFDSFPRHLLRINPSAPGTAQNLMDISLGSWSGPSITADGSRIAFSRRSTGNPTLDGLFSMNLSPPGAPLRIDAGDPDSTRRATNPTISKNGGFTSHEYDATIRWARTDASQLLPVSVPMTRATSIDSYIDPSGNRILYLGAVMPDGNFGFTPTPPINLIVFDWRTATQLPPVNYPNVTQSQGDPSAMLVKQATLGPAFTNTYFFTTTGINRASMYHYPYNPLAIGFANSSIGGMQNLGDWFDDGAFEGIDAVAGDGVYTDGGIWLRTAYLFDYLTARAAIATRDRTAAFADFRIAALPQTVASISRSAPTGNTPPIDFAGARATIDFSSNATAGNVRIDYIQAIPPNLPNHCGQYWHVSGLTSGQFAAILTFQYDPALLITHGRGELGMQLWRSTNGGLSWTLIPAVQNLSTNTIATQSSQSSFSLWALTSQQNQADHWLHYQ